MDFIKKAELIKQMETTKKRELRSVLDLAASAALLVVLNRGAGEISTAFGLNRSFADILTGIILFFIIGSEFFISYKVSLRKSKKEA